MSVTFPRAMQRLAPVGGPLAGRALEMDDLRRAWAHAAGGRGGMVLLGGEPGVGKTRLVAELADEADAAGAWVLIGACPRYGAEPFQPLIEALGPLPTGERDRDAMLDTLVGGVVARARRAPVLLVLDDLHCADRSTLLAVRRIAEAAAGAALLVVATYRDTGLDRSHPMAEFVAAVLSRPGVRRINVGGLSPEAVAEMVGDDDLGRRLWRQSSGNPVWVAELLRPRALYGAAPNTFDELIARRVARLTVPARTFLHAAAVAGTEFEVDVAAGVAKVSAGRLPGVLKEVAAGGFVVDSRRFVHEMVRDAVERGIAPGARVQLHLRIGRALEKQGTAPPSVLAWHYRAAAPVGVSGRALRQSARAGDVAVELLAWDEAAVHYGHALAAAAGVAAEDRADLLLSLGEAQRMAGESARARQAFLEAAAMARSCADGPRMARAALALGQVGAVWGADPELEAVAGEARSLLGQASRPTPSLPEASFFASDSLYDALDGIEVDEAPAAAGVPARPAAALLRARHVALAGPERVGERLEAAEEMVALAMQVADAELAVAGLGWRMVDAMELGRVEQLAADQSAHAEAAHRLGHPGPASDAAAWRAMRALIDGRSSDARLAAAEAYDLAVEAGDPGADASFLLQRWALALEWGTPEQLSQVAMECRARAATAPNGRTWRAVLALAWARNGRLDLAAEELRRVTDHGLSELVRAPDRLQPLACLVEVAWMLGDGYRAGVVGALLEPFADHVVVGGRGLVCQGSVARACGMAAGSARRWDEAERQFRSALGVHRSMGALPLLARTRFEWSIVLDERGRKSDRRRAADWRRKAADLAGGLEMSRLQQEIAARS